MLADDKSEAGKQQQHDQDLSDKFEFEDTSNGYMLNHNDKTELDKGDTEELEDGINKLEVLLTMKLKAKQRQDFGTLDHNNINAIKQLENTKAEISKGYLEELKDMPKSESELEYELGSQPEEKKPPDFGMINYKG